MNFAYILAESGLTKVDLSELYGVSRQTIHIWAAGGTPRAQSLLARQAESITQALTVAIERGLLPLGAMDTTTRRARIRKMAARLQELKPAPIK
jgi:DNA-binding XRE family transcriptional regulator